MTQSGATPLPAQQPDDAAAAARQYSVRALVMLAELSASLLDVIYASDEKDKVLPFLNSVMPNVFPYLRNHRFVLRLQPRSEGIF